MEEHIKLMKILSNDLDRFESNLKKCSTSKRTEGYLEGKAKVLTELYGEMKELNRKIDSVRKPEDQKLEYFTSDYYGGLTFKWDMLNGLVND